MGSKEMTQQELILFPVGSRVYHKRSDLFGRVLERARMVLPGGTGATGKERVDAARLKYEWPYDQSADPVWVPVSELRHHLDVPGMPA